MLNNLVLIKAPSGDLVPFSNYLFWLFYFQRILEEMMKVRGR
jgi:hypothetical protein